MSSSVLSQAVRQPVAFNPRKKEHREAFKLLVLGDEKGRLRQHPTLRFHLPANFTNVRQMMIHQVCESFGMGRRNSRA